MTTKPKRRRIVFEETGEVRKARTCEAFVNSRGDLAIWLADRLTTGKYPIMKCVQNDFAKARPKKRQPSAKK